MIPKIIHYCWFGRGEIPVKAKKCIESWKKYCPDYEIKEWNEDNFDINSNRFVKEAYEARKFAFVTDYVRLYAIYNEGGIYMDSDVEVLTNLDKFLNHRGFTGFELKGAMVTGIMAAEKGVELIKELLGYYKDRGFIKKDGSFDMKTNTKIISETFIKKGFLPNGEYQEIDGFAIYPKDYFCPLNSNTGKLETTKNSATIHWFSKSWIPKSKRAVSKVTKVFHRIFGEDCFKWLKRK